MQNVQSLLIDRLAVTNEEIMQLALDEIKGLRLKVMRLAAVDGKQIPEPLPPWVLRAYSYLGEKEIKGQGHNPKIVGLWGHIKLPGIRNDEVPWCAALQGAIHELEGFVSTRKGNARSYMNWGVPLDQPCVGATVIFWRGKKKGWKGHVGTIVGIDKQGRWLVIGGNQNDAVTIQAYHAAGHPKSRVLGLRWPTGYAMPTNYELPLGTARSSNGNEA